MKKIVDIFKIKHGERGVAYIALLVFSMLNAMTLSMHWTRFTTLAGNYRRLFVNAFHLSGFDPLTYQVLSEWTTAYNIYRHPLLAFFMWPFAMLNKLLAAMTGINFAIVLTSVIVVFCATYSALYIYRIMYEVVEVSKREARILVVLTFGFAFIMLSAMAPDHFIMSMWALTLTLYLAGKKLRNGSALNMWQTIAMFVITAGISLNNGAKVFLAAFTTRGRRFFEWRYLLLAVVMPCALMWNFARWEYRVFEAPQYKMRQDKKNTKRMQMVERLRKDITDTMKVQDDEKIEAELERIIKQKDDAKKKRESRKFVNKNKGEPITQGEFMGWTDITTSRWDAMVENLFGEGIQLHEDYVLGDVLRNRPVVVRYINWFCYVVEAMIVLLFCCGVWRGRKEKFLWTAMSFFIMDMVLHMGLGFGINEIYIMSAHYLFVLPIGIAYLLRSMEKDSMRKSLALVIGAIAVWCWIWNMSLIGWTFVG